MDFFLLYPILLLKHILDDYQLIKPAGISVIKPQYMAIFFRKLFFDSNYNYTTFKLLFKAYALSTYRSDEKYLNF